MFPRRTELILAVLAGLGIALLLHAPLVAAPAGTLPGEAGTDIFRAHWTLWLVGHELPGWPFSTDRVNFPYGARLLPFPAVSLLAAAPIVAVVGPDLGLPILVLALAVFAFLATGWLARTLGAGLGGAALAGALVASQPVLGGALRDGTLEVLAVGWVPLIIGAMVRAGRGQLRWGLVAGLAFGAVCLESVYYASFSVPVVLCSLLAVRSRRGVAGVGLAGLTVLAFAGLAWWAFADILTHVPTAMSSSGDELAVTRSENASSVDMLVRLALSPGARGWGVSDVFAPPALHWGAFAVGAVALAWKAPWLLPPAVLWLGVTLNAGWVTWWTDSALGEVVRFPRRALAPVAVVGAVGAAVALSGLKRWPRMELGAGVLLAAWLGNWGAAASGLRTAYPLVQVPETPAFAAHIAADDEDCAVLFVPLEVPGTGDSLRDELPVFAGLSGDLASADQLFLQTRLSKAGWYTPALVTLLPGEGERGRLARNSSDLARASVGDTVGPSARLPPDSYVKEFAWLEGLGLKYVVVDTARYAGGGEGEVLEAVLDAFSVERLDFGDGTGVTVYRLYDERPAPAPPPAAEGSEDAGNGFSGQVANYARYIGRIEIHLEANGRHYVCPMTPSDGSFVCGGVFEYDSVGVTNEGQEVPFELVGGPVDAVITVLSPAER